MLHKTAVNIISYLHEEVDDSNGEDDNDKNGSRITDDRQSG